MLKALLCKDVLLKILFFFLLLHTYLQVRLYFVRTSPSDELLSPCASDSVSPAHSDSDLLEIDGEDDDSSTSDSEGGESVTWVDSQTTLV